MIDTQRKSTTRGQRRREARRLGLFLEFQRMRELELALESACARGQITYTDLCIAKNELDHAWMAVKASPQMKVATTTFQPGDRVAVGTLEGTVRDVSADRVTVTFPYSRERIARPRPNSGTLYGLVDNKQFKRCSDGSWRNGWFKEPLSSVQSQRTG